MSKFELMELWYHRNHHHCKTAILSPFYDNSVSYEKVKTKKTWEVVVMNLSRFKTRIYWTLYWVWAHCTSVYCCGSLSPLSWRHSSASAARCFQRNNSKRPPFNNLLSSKQQTYSARDQLVNMVENLAARELSSWWSPKPELKEGGVLDLNSPGGLRGQNQMKDHVAL